MTAGKPRSELLSAALELTPFFKRAFVFGLISGLLTLSSTIFMFEVYGRVINSSSELTLAMLVLMILFVYGVMEMLEWSRGAVMQETADKLDDCLSDRVFQVIYDANLRRVPVGGTQPMDDFRTIKDFLPSPAAASVMEVPASFVFLLIMFWLSPLHGFFSLAMAGLMSFVAWLNNRGSAGALTAANRSSVAAQQYADGSLRNAQVIESMGMLHDIHRRWLDKQREFMGFQAVASDTAGAYMALTKFMQTLLGSFLLGLGAWLSMRGLFTGGGGAIIVGSVLGGRVVSPIVQMVTQWRMVATARDAWLRLDDVLTKFPARPSTMHLPAPRGVLRAENLVATPPGSGVPVLRGIAFALQPGEALAVVGPSACGKTSLARVLIGLWPSAGGKVRLDGVDVFVWDKAELGPYIGYLPQGVELLEGTLADNIARFGEIRQSQVEAAAKAVGLHEFIMSLPKGYESPVGRDGTMLSGGERQRVALARAIYGDPVLVVLDEPNSSLDEAGDAALSDAIRTLKARGTTVVVMTHRTSVLAVADKMLILRDGAQQAFGPRDEVLAAIKKASQPVQTPSQTSAASLKVGVASPAVA